MKCRNAARLARHTALTIAGYSILLFLAVFLFGAFRILVLKLIIPIGPVISETIGANRWQFIKQTAATCAPYTGCIAGACSILYFVRWTNRRHDPRSHFRQFRRPV